MQVGPPQTQVANNCDDVRDGGDHPHEPVGPAEEEPGHGADEVGGEVGERLVLQVGEEDLAHRSQHQEDDGANEHIHENHGGARQGDSAAGAHEQAGADGTADGDELDVAVA